MHSTWCGLGCIHEGSGCCVSLATDVACINCGDLGRCAGASFFEDPPRCQSGPNASGNHRRSTSEVAAYIRPTPGVHRRSTSEIVPQRPAAPAAAALLPRPHHVRRASATLQLEPMRSSNGPDADPTSDLDHPAADTAAPAVGDVPELSGALAAAATASQADDAQTFVTALSTPGALSTVSAGSSGTVRLGDGASGSGTDGGSVGTDATRHTRMSSAMSVLTTEPPDGPGSVVGQASPLRFSSRGSPAAPTRTPLSWHGVSISVITAQGAATVVAGHGGNWTDAPTSFSTLSHRIRRFRDDFRRLCSPQCYACK